MKSKKPVRSKRENANSKKLRVGLQKLQKLQGLRVSIVSIEPSKANPMVLILISVLLVGGFVIFVLRKSDNTKAPTDEPTEAPTDEPTEAPANETTEAPTNEPTEAPANETTEAPTNEPTEAPTNEPSKTKPSVSLILGIVGGVLVTFLLVIVGFYSLPKLRVKLINRRIKEADADESVVNQGQIAEVFNLTPTRGFNLDTIEEDKDEDEDEDGYGIEITADQAPQASRIPLATVIR